MLDPQTIAIFSEAMLDRRFAFAAAIAVVAGAVRGFTGFGSALIYMPLISAVYGPRVAAPTLLLIDTVCSFPFAIRAMSYCNWREVRLVTIAGAVGVPLGAMALLYVSPLALRWFIAVLVLIAVAVLAYGWRYHGRPTTAASLGVGALSGFGTGAVQIGAPPLLVYWLGGPNSAVTVRANIMVYFILQGMMTIVAYLFGGLFTEETLVLSLLLGVPFGISLTLGARWFHGISDVFYRRLAYVIIAVSGLLSLPVLDPILR